MTHMRPPDASLCGIFFDLDDTLIGYAEAERAALTASCQYAARIFPAIRPHDLARAIYEIYKSRFAYGTSGFQELATLPVETFRRRLTIAALEYQRIEPATELVHTLVATYAEAESRALRAFADAAATLEALRPYLTLGVITNGPAALQREKLAALELDAFFDLIVVDTEFGHPKPDPRIFEHVVCRTGIPAASLLFVGNSLAYDVTGARRAGWMSAWMNPSAQPLPRHFQPPNASTPDFVIHCLRDLQTLPPVSLALMARPPHRCLTLTGGSQHLCRKPAIDVAAAPAITSVAPT
jgi:putative hydrolase of the HAD superfamily